MKSRQVAVVTPTARERFSASRPMLLLVAITLIALLGAAFLSQMGYNDAPVGIRNKQGDGARALAQVLGDHGISVREVTATQAAEVGDDTTLVVIFPSRMKDSVAKAIETRTNVVYVGLEEDYDSSAPYLGGLRAQRNWHDPRVVTAGCQSEAATRAHSLTSSAYVITGSGDGWELCFSDSGAYYGYAEKSEAGRFRAIIPDSLRLRNRAITEEGNAALAINAIGRTPKVAWYSPTKSDSSCVLSGRTSTQPQRCAARAPHASRPHSASLTPPTGRLSPARLSNEACSPRARPLSCGGLPPPPRRNSSASPMTSTLSKRRSAND